MDSMSVKRESRIAEQQNIVRFDHAFPRSISRRQLHGTRRPVVAIHDIVLLCERQSFRIRNLMPYQDEHQRPATARFLLDIDDTRFPFYLIAYSKGMMKLEPAPCPHPSRQRY